MGRGLHVAGNAYSITLIRKISQYTYIHHLQGTITYKSDTEDSLLPILAGVESSLVDLAEFTSQRSLQGR